MRPVLKLSPTGEVIATYKTMAQAAKENYMHRCTVRDYCNGRFKRKVATDGFIYRWAKR